jgi:hypothetical protein
MAIINRLQNLKRTSLLNEINYDTFSLLGDDKVNCVTMMMMILTVDDGDGQREPGKDHPKKSRVIKPTLSLHNYRYAYECSVEIQFLLYFV